MKKVYLSNISGSYQVVMPYSCGLLHAYCLTDEELMKHYKFEDYIFHVPNGVSEIAESIEEPSVFGLSLLSWNVNRSLKLARLVKEKYPECRVIVGGPEVPDKCEEFLTRHNYIDVAVHKEGEETFKNILKENLLKTPNYSTLDGVTYRQNDKIIHIPRKSAFLNPICTPSPYLLNLFAPCIEYVDSIGLPRLNIWETNRGCPFSCTFCDWGSFVNQKVRPVDEDRVFKEIDYIGQFFDEIHIADANFGILSRDLEIAKRLRNVMNKFGKLKSIHITYTKNLNKRAMEIAELLETLKPSRAGFTFGIQSFDKIVLENVKRQNISNENIDTLKGELAEKGIPVNFEMIIGLPGETKNSFLAGVDKALNLNLTDLRLYQVALYPNSEMNNPQTILDFQLETEKIQIVDGGQEDEHEYVSNVTSTKDIGKDEMIYLKKLVELIDVLHFGKWTFYISKYVASKNKIRIIDFYDDLMAFSLKNKDSIIFKIVKGFYIDHWNSGSWNSFKGPRSPFNINWKGNFFRKGTFFWLCISEQRNDFYIQLREFLNKYNLVSEEIDDLLRFQNEMIIEYGYDPQKGKKRNFEFNWIDYFKNNIPLERKECEVSFFDHKIGRAEVEIKPNDPDSYFHVAGGYQFHFQKVDSFEFDKVKVSYRYDGYEKRFEFQNVVSTSESNS